MKAVLTAFILFSSSAFAGTNGYDLKIDLSVNGKNVISPRVIVKEGMMASVTEDTRGDKTYVEVTATEKPDGAKRAILMKFVVGKIMGDGTRKIISTPQIVALENSKAEIKVGKAGTEDELSLSVVALRKAL
ncbi:hypothetical protein BH10BDE1_BH10BDE1_16550 [soil metagenome]